VTSITFNKLNYSRGKYYNYCHIVNRVFSRV